MFSVKLHVKAWNFTKSYTPPWVFFTLFKLYKWYQILQSITYSTWEYGDEWVKYTDDSTTVTTRTKNWNMILPIFLLSVLLPQPFQTPSLDVFVSQGHLLYVIYKILYNATIFQTLLKKNQLLDLEYHQPVTWSFWKKIQKLTHFTSMHLFNSINFILSAGAHYISLIYFGIMAWNNISIT